MFGQWSTSTTPVSPWHELRYPRIPLDSNPTRSSSSVTRQLEQNHSSPLDPPETMLLPLLLLDNADTLVYIDPPPENNPRQSKDVLTIPHRVHSEKLRATDSTYFNKLFQPRVQARVARQRGYEAGLPAGIRYILDLTPPIIDDDAIILLTEVSCPLGIRTWASQKSLWNLPNSCVGGTDICEPTESGLLQTTAPSPPLESSSPVDLDDEVPPKYDEGTGETEDTNPLAAPLPTSLPVEYSAVRHREGIEHILRAIEGFDISLNTPCKLWTFFAIAKVFDIATIPAVSGYILSWFFEADNTKFIEIHPEIAYRVACGIKAPELCRQAFLVLVGDEALLHLLRSASIVPIRRSLEKFTHSRIDGFLEDTEVQRIEYASKSFAEDIVGHFLNLVGVEMAWLEKITEYRKLLRYREQFPEVKPFVDRLINNLKDFLRWRVYSFLNRAADPVRSSDAHPEGQVSRLAFARKDALQRLIGRNFWYSLLGLTLLLDSDFYHQKMPHSNVSGIGQGLLAFNGHKLARIRYFHRDRLESESTELNLRIQKLSLQENKHESHRFDLPLNLRVPIPNGEGSSQPDSEPEPYEKSLPLRPRKTVQFMDSEAAGSNSTMDSNFYWFNDENMPVDDSLNETRTMGKENLTDRASTSGFPGTMSTSTQPQSSSSKELFSTQSEQFDLTLCLISANTYIRGLARELLFPPGRPSIPLESTDTLSCLTENQFKFLPLWAGGNDDDSGGVFTDQDIPMMETGGFSTPGPAVHTGSTASTEDSFTDIDPSDSRSTVQGASHHATYSHMSYLQSVNSVDEGSIVEVNDTTLEENTGYTESFESQVEIPTNNFNDDENQYNMDGADCSDDNSTLMGYQSDMSDDDDTNMQQHDDSNDDHNEHNDDDDDDVFEMVDVHL